MAAGDAVGFVNAINPIGKVLQLLIDARVNSSEPSKFYLFQLDVNVRQQIDNHL